MRKIEKQHVEHIALGAAVLGTGGGGDPHVGMLMAMAAIEQYGPIRVLSPEEVPDEAWVVSAGMMGAPTVMIEKIPSGREVVGAFEALQAHSGKTISAIYPIEIGGVNSTVPLVLAAMTGLPVVDIDGMGRAFPEVQMTSFELAGLSSAPMSIADEKGNTVIVNGVESVWNERIGRAALISMGGSVMSCDYLMQGKQLKEAGIHHTLTLAERIGQTINSLRHQNQSPVRALVEAIGATLLFTGKISNLLRRTSEGFTKGEVWLDGVEECQGNTFRLYFQNEFLVAKRDDQVAATTPDLITALDLETGIPITTEALRYGSRVAVIGIPCDPKWRTEKGIKTAGPRYFGYDIDYRPLAERGGKDS
ncbi:DUF917 domain-containing protein [Brevibacillus humidisoli]|uniref:DUF917 domain-containing protein n=1 Tax=Brevibacillus humidisoli TaxID=2895522 RepID=UPI001E4665FC|nr:DUF917 domain-containing protein [Brevibacillus humidisoli]UFJ40767.1 DUF917 domain-containing protein [Brevibacillus humidisoli]